MGACGLAGKYFYIKNYKTSEGYTGYDASVDYPGGIVDNRISCKSLRGKVDLDISITVDINII